jgi:hypothetical protein
MDVFPATSAESAPAFCDELLIVARRGFETLHSTDAVTSSVVPSVNVAVAVNACDCPAARVTELGLTAMETIVAGVTIALSTPEIEPSDAVMVALPTARPVISPVAFTATKEGTEEVQVTVVVMS